MPKVGVNNEPLLERAIFGYDGSDYRVVKVDGDGNLVAAVKASQSIGAQSYGYISSAWQKNPITFGYSSILIKQFVDNAPSGGSPGLTGDTVPAGEIWVITNALIRGIFTSAVSIRFLIYDNSVGAVSWVVANPGSLIHYDRQGYWVLPPGGSARMDLLTSVGATQLIMWISGFIIDIDQ